ncbi:glycosyltransferase [Nocardioides sp. SOB44]|uniref:Glycosyltransferase n=2 Tax=Nocardioides cremeus TaxID=3058044 RepID=A0ABT8TVG2_9ACTN|nr:glycosyltransferase [Nocardioides cremeus]MDO3397943.1 glycosyltransferase [Nocardioides cremeus]
MGWEDKVVALHAGNMGVKQGLDTVISAAKLADTESAHVVFVLLGDGNQRSRLEGLSDGVHSVTFIDPVSTSEFQELMQAADTLIVCELEGVAEMSVPSKVTSYLTSGTPIVASVGNGLTRIELERSGGAICVDAGDPAALLGTIQALAADRERAGRLGEQGRSYAFHQLSGDSAIRIFEQTLRSAAATTE